MSGTRCGGGWELAHNHWSPSISSNDGAADSAEVAADYFVGCFFFALARRSCFFRRLARFLALSLPLLCPINLIFARFSSPGNGATGMSDMAGNPRGYAVERSGSCQDTMERMGRAT